MALPEATPAILVSCQQTRFHVTGENASREVDVKGLNIAIENSLSTDEPGKQAKSKSKSKARVDGLEILSGAHLRIKVGGRYALVGRNGSGKSTLLKALTDRLIPGIPFATRIASLQQTAGEPTVSHVSTKTVLAHVVEGDPRRNKLIQELNVITQSIDSNVPLAPVRALRQIKQERFQAECLEVKKAAHLKSGARGAEARKTLLAYEAKAQEWDRRLNEDDAAIEFSVIEAETKDAVNLQADLQSQLDALPQLELEAKAKEVLFGLGFDEKQLSTPFTELSGGWKMRCLLATALVQTVDILILDEPTNYLDLLGILWLQMFLSKLDPQTSLVLVSHDRDFVNATCSEVIILRERTLNYHDGNLDSYDKSARREFLRLSRMKEAQDKQISHMEATIQNNMKQGKKTGDTSKIRQAKSRQKRLDDRTGMNVSSKGTKFKLSRDMIGWHSASRESIEVPKEDREVDMVFPRPPDLRFPGFLLSLEEVAYTYCKANKPALADVNLVVHPGDRIGILGLNGAGKTTLVRLLVSELKPERGTVTYHPRIKVGYYSQHAVDALKNESQNDAAVTALSLLVRRAADSGSEGPLSEQAARGLLSSLGLQGRTVSDTAVAKLSGGQLVRLALAILFLDPPHVFVLDEPTTHLDLPTVTAMIRALHDYDGAIILVTHDRFLMRCVIENDSMHPEDSENDEDDESDSTTTMGLRRRLLYHVKAGEVVLKEGGVNSWEAGLEKRLRRLGL